MPGPFPGMDPYLESPAIWRDIHQSLIYCCRAALTAMLPQGFVARLDQRLYVVEPGRAVLPDVVIARRRLPPSPVVGVAVLDPPAIPRADPPTVVRGMTEEVRESFIEIVSIGEAGRVVTAIEVLSPTNKTPGTGRDEYLRKQRDVLRSDAHLIEIDLLRGGAHTVAAPEVWVRAEHPRWDSIVSLHRADGGAEYEVWPRPLRESLPRITVPLTAGIPDIPLDLQTALARAYDEGAFVRALDYRADPDPPFAPGDAAWADALLGEKGLR